MMVANRHGTREEWEDNSQGLRRTVRSVARPRDIQPISTPLAQREAPPVPLDAPTRIPRAPQDDRSLADVQTYLLPKPPASVSLGLVTEGTDENGKTIYLLWNKCPPGRGGFVTYTAKLGRDGSGELWHQDTDWGHGGIRMILTAEIIDRLHEASLDARRAAWLQASEDEKKGDA